MNKIKSREHEWKSCIEQKEEDNLYIDFPYVPSHFFVREGQIELNVCSQYNFILVFYFLSSNGFFYQFPPWVHIFFNTYTT